MIAVRKAAERRHGGSHKKEYWCTFDSRGTADRLRRGFQALETLNEIRLAPGRGVPRSSCHDVEVVTYVHEGVLAYEDSIGHSGLVQAGEFQLVVSGGGLRHSSINPSRSDGTHFYQLWLRPLEGELEPRHELKRFTVAERRNRLCLVASLDARRGSLRVNQDALVCSSLLDPGQHVVHELAPGRSAWLHLVQGEVRLGDVVLMTGDGAGLTAEPAVSLTASEASEILLVDIGERLPRLSFDCRPTSTDSLSL